MSVELQRGQSEHLSSAALRRFVEAAILAPSGDNTQPWEFELHEAAGSIVIRVDESRDCSPMNAGQRMSRIAVGAAVENVVRTAEKNGFASEVEVIDDQRAIAVRILNPGDKIPQLDDAIRNRCTNRKLYDRRPIPAAVMEQLERSTPATGNVRTHWIVDPERIGRLAALIRRSDAIMFGASQLRRAFLANVRFDLPADYEVEEGLSLACLEVLGAEQVAFRMLPKFPDWLATLMRVGQTIGRKSEKLVRSASGLCVVTAPNELPHTDFVVGRAMQHAWLGLTEAGLSSQPMMSLSVLDSICQNECTALRNELQFAVRSVLDEFRVHFPILGQNRLAFLIRFGNCDLPSGRTGRRAASL